MFSFSQKIQLILNPLNKNSITWFTLRYPGVWDYTIDINDLQPMDTHYMALGSKFPCLSFRNISSYHYYCQFQLLQRLEVKAFQPLYSCQIDIFTAYQIPILLSKLLFERRCLSFGLSEWVSFCKKTKLLNGCT